MTGAIRFLLNGAPRVVADLAPTTTVLDYLRGVEHLTGTKEGCAEGDCGACTVVLGTPQDDGMSWRAVNACLAFLPELDGTVLLTVEGLAGPDGPHPLQAAMVANDASQCGFCTPGFVMALFAFQHGGETAAAETLHEALAGNLCRCTGYRPILAAARAIAGQADHFTAATPALRAVLPRRDPEAPDLVINHGDERYFAPRSLARLLALRAAHPEALLVAGGTDLALLVTKEYRRLPILISVSRVPELQRIDEDSDGLTIGAAVTYSDALPVIERHYPSFGRLLRRLGSRQIRNLGTLGGNIANASPIADTPPALIALGATVVLRSPAGVRALPVEEFFVDYRRTALAADEIVEAVRVPVIGPQDRFRTDKVAKRWDQDISAVCSAIRLTLVDGHVAGARIAYGGVAATPCRARHCEAALTGARWDEPAVDRAIAALAQDFDPISDWRASADYRRQVAGNLLRRFFLETARPELPLEVIAL